VSQRKQHQGFSQAFTVVELLVVIGAITILVGILFVSIGYVHRSMKERQTKAQLGNLKGMLVELDTANGLKTSPSAWLWWGTTTRSSMHRHRERAYTVDFWRSPPRSPNTAAGTFDAMSVPGILSSGAANPADREGAAGGREHDDCHVDAGRASRQPLATSKRPAGADVHPGARRDQRPGDVRPTAADRSNLRPLAQVHYGGKILIGSASFTIPATPRPAAAPSGWEAPTRTAPMLLDGWNNPMIFVPATGLRVKLLNGHPKIDPSFNDQDFIIVSPGAR
jgi:type II secretory pathway pseudopilin PulG